MAAIDRNRKFTHPTDSKFFLSSASRVYFFPRLKVYLAVIKVHFDDFGDLCPIPAGARNFGFPAWHTFAFTFTSLSLGMEFIDGRLTDAHK